MGDESIVPKAKKAMTSYPLVAVVALMLGAGGASAVTISFGGSDEVSKPAPATAVEVKAVKETQQKHEKRIEQNEQGMITVRLALEGVQKEMEHQTEDIREIKETLQRNERRGRRDRRDRDDDNP